MMIFKVKKDSNGKELFSLTSGAVKLKQASAGLKMVVTYGGRK